MATEDDANAAKERVTQELIGRGLWGSSVSGVGVSAEGSDYFVLVYVAEPEFVDDPVFESLASRVGARVVTKLSGHSVASGLDPSSGWYREPHRPYIASLSIGRHRAPEAGTMGLAVWLRSKRTWRIMTNSHVARWHMDHREGGGRDHFIYQPALNDGGSTDEHYIGRVDFDFSPKIYGWNRPENWDITLVDPHDSGQLETLRYGRQPRNVGGTFRDPRPGMLLHGESRTTGQRTAKIEAINVDLTVNYHGWSGLGTVTFVGTCTIGVDGHNDPISPGDSGGAWLERDTNDPVCLTVSNFDDRPGGGAFPINVIGYLWGLTLRAE